MREKVCREPEGGPRAWVFLLIACYFLIETVFFREGLADRLVYLTFGLAVLGFGLVELVPRNRTRLAGALRMGGVALMVLILAVRATQLITPPG